MLSAIPTLHAVAMSLCGQRTLSDDLVQETLLRALTKKHLFQPGSNMEAWLSKILRNLFYTAMRRRRREVEDDGDRLAQGLAHLPAQEDVVDLRSLFAAMAKLPAAQREALLLVGAEGYTYEEAALRLECEIGTVKSRVSRARQHLHAGPRTRIGPRAMGQT